MSPKPVYLAGQGFRSADPPPRPVPWRPLVWILPLLLAAGLAGWLLLKPQPAPGTVRVLSTPAGAEIWLDLAFTGLHTPAELPPGARPALLQVRLPGHFAQPLSVRLDPARLPEQVEFQLSMQAPAPALSADSGAAEAGGLPAAAPPAAPPAVGLAPLLEKALRQPAGVPEHPDESLRLTWQNWDPAYRLKVDGRVLDPAAARQLTGGAHRIVVELAGRPLLDTLLRGGGARTLVLPAREGVVEVRVSPAEAEIVQGERVLGRGRCLIPRSDLPLNLRFPALPGLLPPAPLTLTATAPASVSVRHVAGLSLGWSPAAPGVQGLTLAERGYVMPGATFTPDRERGPKLERAGLLLGRAFHDRRPGGSQAARFTFDLPRETQPGWPAVLELSARDSGRRYPLTLTRGALLTVSLNGTVLARDLELEEGGQTRSWPVSSLLRPGSNELLLQSGAESRSAARLDRLHLKVGP
ncbi:MAG: hypothetical protein WC326_07185 [Candidatus Delongbacteria bacterium]